MKLPEIGVYAYLFAAGAGLVMSLSLWWWQRRQNGNRRIPSWVIAVESWGVAWLMGYTGWHVWSGYPEHRISGLWALMLAVLAIDAGLVGHIWVILKRKHHAELQSSESDRREHGP